MKSRSSFLCSCSFASLLVLACGDDKTSAKTLPANAAEAVNTYSAIVSASYRDALSTANALDTAVGALVATPSAATQTAAKNAWLASREPYLQTEVYRFYNGPIDNEEDGPEGLLNAWPLDENHIDYVVGAPNAGIVNDPQAVIAAEALMAANESPGEKDIATGYHAVEFLLWGQDLDANGAGARSFTDYMTTGGTNANQARRGQYLTTAAGLIVENLQQLVDAWAPNSAGNYRSTFVAETPADALGKIMSGMIILTGFETGQERVQAALDAHSQEEEHSCFSDNTHRDMIQDVQGVQNVWLGRYDAVEGADVSGTGIRDVIAAGDPALASSITAQIEASLAAANALQPPFDREIATGNTAGNARVQTLVDALFQQRELLEQAFEVYGLSRIQDPE
jgi:putative iron-regulated protein